jgi:hypothetical protein
MGEDFSVWITTDALSSPMTLKGKELMVGIGSLLANMLLVIFMIGFVILGLYTDGAYAYSTLTPENYFGTVTT